MQDVIAVLEDDQRRAEAMKEEIQRLVPHARTAFFDSAPDMVAWLQDNLPLVMLLSLDHDLGPDRQRQGKTFDPGIGRDVAEFLVTRAPSCSVLIHSSNVEAAHGMQFTLEDAGWSVERVAPFDDLAWIKAQWSGLVVVIVEKAKKQ